MSYWSKKEQLKSKAIAHNKYMEDNYKDAIDECANNTITYTNYLHNNWEDICTHILTIHTDSVSAIFLPMCKNKKVCVLNFASYKNAGGGFLNGSSAQEESLCHESFLYNVLEKHQEYYEWNRKHLNRGMYLNRALYSLNVVFLHDGQEREVDVLTCASPNYSVALKYNNFTKEENQKALESRIKFIKNILAENKVDVAILGAFGCGVFKQDPYNVANLWKKDGFPVKEVIYAIIDEPTYNIFTEVI